MRTTPSDICALAGRMLGMSRRLRMIGTIWRICGAQQHLDDERQPMRLTILRAPNTGKRVWSVADHVHLFADHPLFGPLP